MTSQTAKRTLETLVGPLAQTFPQFERDTIRHSDQLTTERRTNPELRNMWFYTADGPMYLVEKVDGIDEAFLYLGRGETNSVFNNIEEATHQLIRTGNYILPKEKRGEIDAVIKAEDTLKVRLSDLRLQGNDSQWRYFEIGTANYDSLNEHQRGVAERVYGSGDDFVENMKMFNEAGKRKLRVYVLNPAYVKQNVPQDGALARASWLYNFELDSWFIANDSYVDLHFGLRGVRNVAEGDAQKLAGPIADAYKTILGSPDQALRAMTPEIVTGFLN
ncbi:hypothetical protein HYW19_03460 [Candidatus Woesearchaeota archaeon]|nr:hypothetical protein [Candidatus Woesearchaeota archaeon]